MFGRQPRLAIDAFLGLKPSGPQCRTPQDHDGRLKERLAYANHAAAKEAKRNATSHKEFYDRLVRHAVGIRGSS